MIRRPPRSTLDRSSAASDVYKRQIMDGGSLARMGPYIVVLEVYDLAGNVEKFKKTVTLAHRLD